MQAQSPVASACASAAVASASPATASARATALPPATPTATVRAPDVTASAPSLQWLKALPSRAVTAHVDDLVWAAVPTEKEVRVGIYRVLAVKGHTASLLDLVRVRWDAVPGALILPVSDPARLRPDQLVTYADWRGYVGIGVVVRIKPKIRIAFRDALAVVREETANIAEPFGEGIRPLGWVAFPRTPDAEALHKGMVFAMDGDNLFVRDEANQAFVVDKSRAKPLVIPQKKLKQGDAVQAYALDRGYRAGTVEKIFLPGMSYGVNVDGTVATYFFSDLALAPP